MSTPLHAKRILATVHKSASAGIMDQLFAAGVGSLHQTNARTSALEEKKVLLGLSTVTKLADDTMELLSILTTPESESAALNLIIEKARLKQPGMGAVISEDVNIVHAHPVFKADTVTSASKETKLHTDITGISCIVQRGQADPIARIALDMGAGVPATTFGVGTGVRDKLGLLRIAIPAEKEVVHVTVVSEEASGLMERMIEAGRLDLPGKGFIYTYPVGKGWLNTALTRGMPGHAASIDQVIAVIDDIKGGTDWRRKAQAQAEASGPRRIFLTDLVDFTLYCAEGRGADLVKAAMDIGVPGATIGLCKHRCGADASASGVSQARDACVMILGEAQVPKVVEVLEKAGAFDDKTHGLIVTRPAPKAFTFLGKS